jgi:DNA-binding transcriptional LysR family regulator
MTLDQLRIFVAVAERQHLTQAADALALTPSAVSASIRTLEDRYGTPLFDRVGRRIEVNAAGRLFLVEARATLARAAAAERTLIELAGLERGVLALHASQTIASYWLPAQLVRFRQRYPQIEIRLDIGNTEAVAQAVLDGAADLGLVEGALAHEALAMEVIGQDSMVVVVAPGHPWAGAASLGAAELEAGDWVMRERGSGTRSAFEEMLAQLGVRAQALRVALTMPSNEALRAAVSSAPYAAGLSELVAAPWIAAGMLAAAPVRLPRRDFHLLRHAARQPGRAAEAFADLLRGS